MIPIKRKLYFTILFLFKIYIHPTLNCIIYISLSKSAMYLYHSSKNIYHNIPFKYIYKHIIKLKVSYTAYTKICDIVSIILFYRNIVRYIYLLLYLLDIIKRI